MNDYISKITNQYRTRGIIVDTNLLLLYFIGRFDRTLIKRFKRTKSFSDDEYDLLKNYINLFSVRVTTPNIMTEVSSFASQLGNECENFFNTTFLKETTLLSEEYLPSKEIINQSKHHKFHLTDCGIIILAKKKYLLLTDDFKLSKYFDSIGGNSVNFNHIRTIAW